jgi:Rv2525c-like, glycoside hydrolase-like domain
MLVSKPLRTTKAGRFFSLMLLAALSCALATSARGQQKPALQASPTTSYLGFDANEYPGDALLPRLRQTFAFSGYWLNNPPGTAAARTGTESATWLGHRAALAKQGFGFLVLFNGRLGRELKSAANASALGRNDAWAAAATAKREGFAPGAVIFVDQEEGGSMNEKQMAYLLAWFDGIATAGFRPGIYCSAMPSKEAGEIVFTADYVRNHAGPRKIVYFVFNDACPPSPGCAYLKNPPPPSASGIPFVAAWQFSQSPRRRNFTRRCGATYSRDGNCYAPDMGPGSPLLDLDTATSPDPSAAR